MIFVLVLLKLLFEIFRHLLCDYSRHHRILRRVRVEHIDDRKFHPFDNSAEHARESFVLHLTFANLFYAACEQRWQSADFEQKLKN